MTSKPELFARVEHTFSQLTPSEKRVAGWLLAHAAQIPFETADGIAKATGTSGITVGRYLRKLGFRNLEDAKASLRELPVIPYQPWGMNERLDSWHQQQRLPDRAQQSLLLEIDAITHVYQLAQSDTFLRIAQQLAHAEAVYILGIQSTRGIANAFFSHLEYLRPKVSYSEGLSGSWVESLNSGFDQPYVVITDMRAYSATSRQYCRVARDRHIPLALITDVWCPWARDYGIDLLQVKTDTGHFWDSLAPVSCLFNLLLSAVVAQLGDALAGRLQTNRQLQQQFGQFEQ
ncbi:MurR/RpiR family transcriptional regulator [Citrobacter sp. C348]|jgi:DNA-binding MurR/RpiR family transcriptional regulator|uniref:MurR/RpiR family transcriptional regulator n=1 Tax=Citrobacter freundii TaxID=546 RepID=A0A7D6ZM03_CITFR|nr:MULTISPECIES: MurR/RpiR family transcriptional regulator [Citrobacter]STE16941.1 bifunctional glucokinase/RpiR family transcriptional regulator [Escherichia coli]MBA7730160.1 MurR/RpiR family transcriptional regulator [Citrobacter freundii]MCS3464585.1 DNA-binding MurR/RpiR family transcriptional regulator [Citrobacter sp. JUb117]QLO14143.1 MurR/RpiR family transcriptional regulator [Citrobacter freundii]QLS06119.1 MurR/RpiR family transcriptional regulator [Citrobacter freundii]